MSAIGSSTVLRPLRDPSNGLTSRRASYVVSCTMGTCCPPWVEMWRRMPACAQRLSELLVTLLTDAQHELVVEALGRMAKRGVRLSPELLPLALRQTDPELRAQLRPVLGARGKWLAEQKAEWHWAAEGSRGTLRGNTRGDDGAERAARRATTLGASPRGAHAHRDPQRAEGGARAHRDSLRRLARPKACHPRPRQGRRRAAQGALQDEGRGDMDPVDAFASLLSEWLRRRRRLTRLVRSRLRAPGCSPGRVGDARSAAAPGPGPGRVFRKRHRDCPARHDVGLASRPLRARSRGAARGDPVDPLRRRASAPRADPIAPRDR